jgi:hypothetical protein
MARFKIGGSYVNLTHREPQNLVDREVTAIQNMAFLSATRRQWGRDQLNESINWKNWIVESVAKFKTADGKVYLDRSGMDCDCVQYAGDVACIDDATPKEVAKFIEHCEYWADGPIHFRFITEEQAKRTRYQSCDLVARAHEDGHPGYISPADCNF